MKQTQVNDLNRSAFYRLLYPMQSDSKANLIDINQFADPVVAIDCCGWHYADIFNRSIYKIESLQSVKDFEISRDRFDRLIDNSDIDIRWPNISIKPNAVILDRSPLLKYRTLNQLQKLLHDIGKSYQPSNLLMRGRLEFIDDDRLTDRFHHWSVFKVENYVTVKFLYDSKASMYEISLRRKK